MQAGNESSNLRSCGWEFSGAENIHSIADGKLAWLGHVMQHGNLPKTIL